MIIIRMIFRERNKIIDSWVNEAIPVKDMFYIFHITFNKTFKTKRDRNGVPKNPDRNMELNKRHIPKGYVNIIFL